MKRLLIYYWYNVRWSRLLLLLVVIGVAGLLFGPRLFGSKSHYQKSKYGVARYRVIFYVCLCRASMLLALLLNCSHIFVLISASNLPVTNGIIKCALTEFF